MPTAMAPPKMNGRRRPQRVWVLSEMYPMSGSVKASVSRGMAPRSPTRAGFMPRPRFSTIIMPPLAAASRLLAEGPEA